VALFFLDRIVVVVRGLFCALLAWVSAEALDAAVVLR
jgi:hypothetical protein